ncbi:MAG TPA: endonuclease/exonuclease/phosphatase family protein [Actinomycetota bacterium]
MELAKAEGRVDGAGEEVAGTPRPARPVASVARLGQAALVAVVVLLTLQVTRVFFVLVSDLGERSGKTSDALLAGGLALVVFLAPLLSPLVRGAIGARGSLLATAGALVGLRLAIQLLHPVTLGLAAAATVVALISLTLLFVAMRWDGERTAGLGYVLGTLLGLTLDTALRAGFRSWDSAWQDGPGALILAILPAALALLLLFTRPGRSLRPRGERRTKVLPLAALGPFLMLQVLFLQSPAFVASAAGVSLMVASSVVLVGDALALAAVAAVGDMGASRPRPLLAGMATVVIAYLLTRVVGGGVVPLALVGQVLAALLLATAFMRPSVEGRASVWRTSAGFALGGAALTLLVFIYQVAYRVPLPISNALVPPAAALLLALGAIGFRYEAIRRTRFRGQAFEAFPLAVFPLVLLLVPIGVSLAGQDVRTGAGDGRSFRLVSYNVHLGVNLDGQLDPEGIARSIEGEDPDVVALQEVGRGWVIGGTMDLAEWLSHRLRMPYVYAPAADGQFGNLLLSRLPILGSKGVFLTRIDGVQQRSYLLAEIDIGHGRSVTLIDAHLEGEDLDHAAQVERLLAAWGGGSHTIIAGDLNMQPDDPDRTRFDEAGLVSAQDSAGRGGASTAAEPKFPGDRVDWIFGTADVSFSKFHIGRTRASDHLPLAVTVTVP